MVARDIVSHTEDKHIQNYLAASAQVRRASGFCTDHKSVEYYTNCTNESFDTIFRLKVVSRGRYMQ